MSKFELRSDDMKIAKKNVASLSWDKVRKLRRDEVWGVKSAV